MEPAPAEPPDDGTDSEPSEPSMPSTPGDASVASEDPDAGPVNPDSDASAPPPNMASDGAVVSYPGDAGAEAAAAPAPPPPCGGACGEAEVCNPATEECVDCLQDEHCEEDFECRANVCEAIVPCEEPLDCTEDLPVCHSQLDRCVGCEIDLDCPVDELCVERSCVEASALCEMGEDPCSSGAVMPLLQTQVVDGVGDEFCELPGFELNFDNAARGNSDLPHGVVARVAWSAEAFHLYAEVEDPELVANPELDYLWSGDVVELFLATSSPDELPGFFSGRIDGVQLVFAPPSGDLPARAARLYWLPNEDNPDSYVQVREPMSTGFAARATATGYAIEAAIPWSSFGPRVPDIQSGLNISFDFGLSTANADTIGNDGDGRQGAATLFVGEPTEGVNTCDGEQLPWCNATTWCSVELQ